MVTIDLAKKHLQDMPENNDVLKADLIKVIAAYEELEKAVKNNAVLPHVSGSLAADIRNKLSPVKNLCTMLKNREVDPYMEKNDKLNDLVDSEIEKALNVVEWLSGL